MHDFWGAPPIVEILRSQVRQMRARFFVLLFVVMCATTFAQQGPGGRGGAPAVQGQGGRGGAPAAQGQGGRGGAPAVQGPPAGVQALPLDLFLSKNFYKDQALWMDKR